MAEFRFKPVAEMTDTHLQNTINHPTIPEARKNACRQELASRYLVSDPIRNDVNLTPIKGSTMDINNYTSSDGKLTKANALKYAQEVSTACVNAYKDTTTNSQGKTMATAKKVITPNTDGIEEAAAAVVAETKLNAQLIGGEILLDNIQTVAENLILSRLSWWKRLTIKDKDKEIAVTLATYAIVHAIKTGGFGLTQYRINHEALNFVTVAANHRLLKYVQRAVGVNTNIAEMILSKPVVSIAEQVTGQN